MKIGVALPSTAIGTDPNVVRDYAQAAEEIGFDHLAVYDHVVGVNPDSYDDWSGPYTSKHSFHDPFALFGFLAGLTTKIILTPQVLILAQRQTVLVARQAASVDALSGGRLRLGVGIGWNPVEFTALGEDFSNRGQRSLEQIEVMQALWSNPHVKFSGQWHEIPDVGLNPMPVQRPIPVWLGGHHDNVLWRIAAVGDGWISLLYHPNEEAERQIARLREMVREAGRPEDAVGIDSWVSMAEAAADGSTAMTTPDRWREEIDGWQKLGISHVTLNTAFNNRHHRPISGTSVDEHIGAIRQYHETVSDLL